MKIFVRQRFIFLPSLILLSVTTGCASRGHVASEKMSDEEQTAQLTRLKALNAELMSRVDSLENKLSALNEKFDSTRTSMESFVQGQKLKTSHSAASGATNEMAVSTHPADSRGSDAIGVPVKAPLPASDSEAGFVRDSAVEAYRKAMLLMDAAKYPETILALSSFLEAYPDHPYAGSAQYQIGVCYFRQKEYKLSLQEFQRVLTSYDRSPQVADSLRMIADAEDQLKMKEAAARHRQLLLSLFPNSPAAHPERMLQRASDTETSQRTTANATAISGLDEPPPPTAPIQVHPQVAHEEKN